MVMGQTLPSVSVVQELSDGELSLSFFPSKQRTTTRKRAGGGGREQKTSEGK
jgi:hypothetical protein